MLRFPYRILRQMGFIIGELFMADFDAILEKIDGVQKVLSAIYALADFLSALREDPLEYETLPTIGNNIKDAVRAAQNELSWIYKEISSDSQK